MATRRLPPMPDTQQAEIDVLVVCQHDAEMVGTCLTSCKEGATNRVNLWVWLNGKDESLIRVLAELKQDGIAHDLTGASSNFGFIRPNNHLAAKGTAPYICLLNADTVCAPGWDVPLVKAICSLYGGYFPSIVGYSGGWLSADGVGRYAAFPGAPCDYVEGWCLMTTRAAWEALGGFDEANLTLAYGEDSDLCLRAKERGLTVAQVENKLPPEDHPRFMATGGQCVMHLRDVNGGIGKGASEETRRSPELQAALQANHAYLRERHKAHLERERVLVKDYERPICQTARGADETFIVILGPKTGNIPHLLAREIDGRLWEVRLHDEEPVRMLLP